MQSFAQEQRQLLLGAQAAEVPGARRKGANKGGVEVRGRQRAIRRLSGCALRTSRA